MDNKAYFVPFSPYAEDKFEDKRSKFTGRLWHVESAQQALEKLKEIRETYWDATHHCWAYIIREGQLMRYSDDGEPQGTAGQPILEVLRHRQLQDVLCVVTRYYGGILLGTGGLVRAYTQGAKIAVEAAGVMHMSLFSVLLIAVPYDLLAVVLRVLPEHDCDVTQTEYGADVTLTATIPVGGATKLAPALAEVSAGRVFAQVIEEKFMGRKEV